jgi:hypothetical protein
LQKQILKVAKFFLLFFFFFISHIMLFAQVQDSVPTNTIDTVNALPTKLSAYQSVLQNTVLKHQYLSVNKQPTAFIITPKKNTNKEAIFYLLATLALILGCLKAFYSKYFYNLFKVFFNTSLRQSQLTDQLLQAKLPSLLYNIFFIISGGLYAYLLLLNFNKTASFNNWVLLLASVIFLAGIYTVKYASLKFTGWVTGYSETTNTYTFVLFLINKILGIVLVPLSIAIAFVQPIVVNSLILVSLCCVAFMFVLRFFRSYGLLQNQLKISRFHFFLYIIGVEILPLLLIYKGLVIFLGKNA